MINTSYDLWSINDHFSNKNSNKYKELPRDGKLLLHSVDLLQLLKLTLNMNFLRTPVHFHWPAFGSPLFHLKTLKNILILVFLYMPIAF